MAKAVFRAGELISVSEKVIISAPAPFHEVDHVTTLEEKEELEQEEAYTGPTAEELRREAEAFAAQWKIEKETMIESAKAEANEIVQAADFSASNAKQEGAEEAESMRVHAKAEAERMLAEAQLKAQQLEDETRRTLKDEKKAALDQAREVGRAEGYAEGKTEVDRLIQRTQIVLERAQDKRGEILLETEQEIIDLVLLISRKVIKVISENQREVVASNVVQALRKVKDRGKIIIRVNLVDLKLATEHTADFIKMLEGVQSIQVLEDSSVDSGGCIIETDFGEIDARISSQLAELEAKIREISPIKAKAKPSAGTAASGTVGIRKT
jgi:flagellar assembly protein FliH